MLPVAYEPWMETQRLYDPEELAQRINTEGIAVLVVEADFLFEELFQEARPLRFVGLCRNSLHHVDIDAATKAGVSVVYTPARNARAVAEHVMGLMLSLARGVPRAHDYVASGKWEQPTEPYVAMRGLELQGKTAGVIGLGAIGTRVAELCLCFGMGVLAYDPYVDVPREGVEMVPLDELLQTSDFVTIHAPPNDQTSGMIDSRRLDFLKPTAFLINTADASIVEQGHLAHKLKKRELAGAAMDVFETHPIAPNSPFLRLDNVVLTPHIGGATEGTIERQARMIVDDLSHFLKGERPVHLANPEVWER